ncbi:HipA family kinase [Kytococcus schroeteri]|uniref:HipA family kinase n=1 Tax=Kytococcus schroeteri TaxID=138300 RepID=UPI001142AC75|nr:HipA family kinase [Kytococcus schroeteri]
MTSPWDPTGELPRRTAVRYVTPLREGGSMPGVVEADDLGTYVMKFRSAGQGVKVLVAEVVVGELARALDLPVPEMVALELPEALSRYEPDEEVQDLLRASIGLNLGTDFLPGAHGYDGSVPPAPEVAARLLWLDAFTANVDRTWSNPNLVVWHGVPWLIDHGAALYFHHAWPGTAAEHAPDPARSARQPFDASQHVTAAVVPAEPGTMARVHAELAPRTGAAVREAVAAVPGEWLETTGGLPTADAVRDAYVDFLTARLAGAEHWLPGDDALAAARAGAEAGRAEAQRTLKMQARRAVVRQGEEPR